MSIRYFKISKFYYLYKWKAIFVFAILPLLYTYYIYQTLPFFELETESGAVVYDSLTYMRMAEQFPGLNGLGALILINKNLLGPVSLVQILNNSMAYILLFNIVIFYSSVNSLIKSASFSTKEFLILLVANPMIFSSLTSINKEILASCAIMLALAYSLSRKRRYMLFSILLAIFSRFELVGILILYFLLGNIKNARHRRALIYVLVGAITIAIPATGGFGSSFLLDHQNSDSIGLSVLLDNIALNFGFFVVLIPKIALNLFGDIKLIISATTDGNLPFTAISGMLFLALTMKSLKKIRPANNIGLLIILYSIAFAIPAFIHHRYYVPIYPAVLALVCLRRPLDDLGKSTLLRHSLV